MLKQDQIHAQQSSRAAHRILVPLQHTSSHIEADVPALAPSAPIVTPALVSLRENILLIRAENSSLTQILHDISKASGMVVEGNFDEEHIYGAFGPAEPATVLAQLLEGTKYNILILGGSGGNGLKQLVLTQRTGKATPPSDLISSVTANSSAPAAPAETPPSTLGPGAIEHPPPPPSQTDEQRIQQNLRNLTQRHMQMQGNTPQ